MANLSKHGCRNAQAQCCLVYRVYLKYLLLLVKSKNLISNISLLNTKSFESTIVYSADFFNIAMNLCRYDSQFMMYALF